MVFRQVWCVAAQQIFKHCTGRGSCCVAFRSATISGARARIRSRCSTRIDFAHQGAATARGSLRIGTRQCPGVRGSVRNKCTTTMEPIAENPPSRLPSVADVPEETGAKGIDSRSSARCQSRGGRDQLSGSLAHLRVPGCRCMPSGGYLLVGFAVHIARWDARKLPVASDG
jgi:hypothetical protein